LHTFAPFGLISPKVLDDFFHIFFSSIYPKILEDTAFSKKSFSQLLLRAALSVHMYNCLYVVVIRSKLSLRKCPANRTNREIIQILNKLHTQIVH
jgi:hypothetical protein